MLIKYMKKALLAAFIITGSNSAAIADPAPSSTIANPHYRLKLNTGKELNSQSYLLKENFKRPGFAEKKAALMRKGKHTASKNSPSKYSASNNSAGKYNAGNSSAVLVSDNPTPGKSVAIFTESDKLAGQPFSREIALAAAAAALDPALVHAVIYVESRYRQNAVSPMGAIGLMQLMPDTAARYGVKDPSLSAKVNIKAGTLYLRDLLRMFDNRTDLALAAYNAGEGAVLKYSRQIPPYRETQMYVRAVLAKYNEWQGGQQPGHQLRSDAITALDEATVAQPHVEYLAGTRLSIN